MAGGGGGGGGFVGFIAILVLIAIVPKPVWIVLGISAGVAFVVWVAVMISQGLKEHRKEVEEQQRLEQIARKKADAAEREARKVRLKQYRIDMLGRSKADLVEKALAAADSVGASEAAREGWLGDTDFGPDIADIFELFAKAYALRKVANDLDMLPNPDDDDRRLLDEARATYAELETDAEARVALIAQCAAEAQSIDISLEQEREDARTAEQRAHLHGQLSAMLYGIAVTPDAPRPDSAADRVMARVQAYREIKKQIQQARDGA